MDTTLSRDLAGVDVPPFSYTGIAHTFRNSPFNEYPYAMARLRWFTDSFDPSLEDAAGNLVIGPESGFHDLAVRLEDESRPEARLALLRSVLLHRARLNGHFTYLQVSDAGLVDSILDTIYRIVTGGQEREKRNLGPHEPGIGRWVNEDDFNERYWLELPEGTDRQGIYDRVTARLRAEKTDDATFDEVYLYPPDYGDDPGGPVRHAFRIFGHSGEHPDSDASPGRRLREAAEAVLADVTSSSAS